MTCILDDDEAEIEAEIQRELDALGDDSLFTENVENSLTAGKAVESKEDGFPDSIQEYLRLLHSRTEGFEEEVKECEIILEKLPPDSTVKEDEDLLAKRIKEELGDQYKEHPLVLRDQVLSELEEVEIRAEREKLAVENKEREENKFALDIVRPGVLEEIQALEEKAQQELRELEAKQAGKEKEREKWYQEKRREEEERREREKIARIQRQVEFEAAQKTLLEQQEALKVKLEVEAKEEERKLKEIEVKFQVEIRAIEEEREKQKEAFVATQLREAEYQQQKQENAATKIQKFYRGHRVRKEYQPVLKERRVERIRKRQEELDRIERVERKLREEAERKRLEDEQKRKEEYEKRKREEGERRKQEEAEKQRKLEEEERQKKEEQERQRVLEEERRKKEEEEEARKKREEEEKRKKREEEIRRKKQEEEKRREEELIRKLEEDKKKVEEAARKTHEEEKKLREAELKRREEEEKRKVKENMIQEEDKRRKELEEKRKLEEQKRRDKEEQQKEDERKQKHKQKILEEEKQRMEKEVETRSKVESKMETFQEGSKEKMGKRAAFEKPGEKKEEIKPSELKKDEEKAPVVILASDLEARRLQWVKEHTPWSATLTAEERSHPVAIKSKPRRVFSASKHLPALTEEQLLKSSPLYTPLFRVKCISLRDEPSCSMQGLSQCPELRSLILQNCGLLAVEGLEKCNKLQELNVEGNKIEAINCRDLSKLEGVSLANNNLASVHGLEGCGNIMHLDLRSNKITRIGDLSFCGKLQQLILDDNQLINTKGLSSLKNLQHLSLAHNHLARVAEIEKCMLLQTLNLQANNLQEPPHLTNCVLLRDVRLDDNSISSLDCLTRAWLPLLQFLSVSQNSISQVSPLRNLFSLESLDISNNLISDTDSLVPGLQSCQRLKTLKIEGNPLHEDPACRTVILEVLPDLENLDGENLPGKGKVTPANQAVFVDMCYNQLQAQEDLQLSHKKQIGSYSQTRDPELVAKRLGLMSHYFKERFELAVRHVLEHENFSADSYQSEVRWERKQTRSRRVGKATELQDNSNKERKGSENPFLDRLKEKHAAATKIQAVWRGWHIRHLIDVNTTKWLAAVTIQAVWRGYLVRSRPKKEVTEPWDPKRNSAATVIQAHFRGQRVRRRLAEALKAAQFYDNDDEEEFDYDEEVDLAAFDFDETFLEQGWTPSETPQLPGRGPVLRIPRQSSKTPKPAFRENVSNAPTVPQPRHAWRSADSPITSVNQAAVGKETMDHDQMSVTSGAQSNLSHRAEELSNEWGFQNSQTAELMMRRAKKMKYNPARRKKLLDPNKRLALFKKLEETNKLRDVRPPPTRRQPPPRIDYFAAREAMGGHLASTSPASEQHTREQMTYSWVYRQAVVHEDEEQNIMSDRKEYAPDNRKNKTSPQKTNRSPVSLPHMDPVVLSGRTLPLTSSPALSQSLEQTPSEGTTPRRNSLSSEGRVRFPAIKTHSVPNLLARSTASGDQPIRTEKSNSAGARINRDTRKKR